MKRSFSNTFSSAVLVAGLLAFAPGSMAAESDPAVCLPTDTMTSVERVDRKTMRVTTEQGQSVIVSTQGRCTLKSGDLVRLVQRGETACLSKGDRLRSMREECRVSSVAAEASDTAS